MTAENGEPQDMMIALCVNLVDQYKNASKYAKEKGREMEVGQVVTFPCTSSKCRANIIVRADPDEVVVRKSGGQCQKVLEDQQRASRH